ncbi:hypothetical protein DV738_g544, partial [Chaetothyriales sp. CBS 135597]
MRRMKSCSVGIRYFVGSKSDFFRDPNTKVILLEAGPDAIDSVQVNTYYPTITEYFWNFTSEPDPNLAGGSPQLPQGLSWASLLEDFKAGSHYTFQPADYEQFVNTSVYGDGPIEVIRASSLTGFDIPFAQALQSSLGLQEVDMDDGSGIGTFPPRHRQCQRANYTDDPRIFSNYSGTPADKAALLWAYKKLREILASPELKSVVKQELYPGANVTSDAEVWAAILQQRYSFRHPLGTVSIGQGLGANWRLNGLDGIRVVDVSTFPYPPSCHPQASVYVLAYRATGDIIAADRRRRCH